MPEEYVTTAAWLRQVGRPDLIDDVADQFERPPVPGATPFWSPTAAQRWPRTSRGWRSRDLFGHRAVERDAVR